MKPALLVDIEGTVGAISFVRTVLFPYARRHLPRWVSEHGHEPETRRWLDHVALELGGTGAPAPDDRIVAALLDWIDADRKHTALKALQGLLWRDGYLRGEYQAHLYPDAVAALQRWHEAGHALYVYSSGSVAAQKLYFGHSVAGNLLGLFTAYFDTEIGAKNESASYRRIAERIGRPASEVVFLSDALAELDAARAAQMATLLVDRPQDHQPPREAGHDHRRVVSLDGLDW